MPADLNLVSWAGQLLQRLGITANESNVTAVVAWALAEGGHVSNSATWNPLNTTLNTDAAVRTINSHGVKAYRTYADGLDATVRTLQHSRYAGVRSALSSGGPAELATAVGSSAWGTSRAGILATVARADELVQGSGGWSVTFDPLPGIDLPGIDAPSIGSDGIDTGLPNPLDAASWVGDLAADVVGNVGKLALGMLLAAGGLALVVIAMSRAGSSATSSVVDAAGPAATLAGLAGGGAAAAAAAT